MTCACRTEASDQGWVASLRVGGPVFDERVQSAGGFSVGDVLRISCVPGNAHVVEVWRVPGVVDTGFHATMGISIALSLFLFDAWAYRFS